MFEQHALNSSDRCAKVGLSGDIFLLAPLDQTRMVALNYHIGFHRHPTLHPPPAKTNQTNKKQLFLGGGIGGNEQGEGSGGSAVVGSPWSRWEKLENPIMVLLRLRVDLGFTAVSVLNSECRKLACLSNCCPVAKIKTLGCIPVSVFSAVEIGPRCREDGDSDEHE